MLYRVDSEDAVMISITRDGHVYLSPGNLMVQANDLPSKVKDLQQNRSDKTVYIQADARARFSSVTDVMDALRTGVPLLAIPIGFDQKGVAARIAYRGVGKRLSRHLLSANAVQSALKELLAVPSFRQRASTISSEIASYGGVQAAAGLEAGARGLPSSARYVDGIAPSRARWRFLVSGHCVSWQAHGQRHLSAGRYCSRRYHAHRRMLIAVEGRMGRLDARGTSCWVLCRHRWLCAAEDDEQCCVCRGYSVGELKRDEDVHEARIHRTIELLYNFTIWL